MRKYSERNGESIASQEYELYLFNEQIELK